MNADSLIEVVDVHHDGKHHRKLSVRKDRDGRETWCSRCLKAVWWDRVTPRTGTDGGSDVSDRNG